MSRCQSHTAFFRKSIVLAGLFLAVCAILSMPIYAQEPVDSTEQDSLWLDEDWDMEDLNPETFEFENDLIKHYSHGWFPQAQPGMSLSGLFSYPYADVFDRAKRIRPRGFAPTTAAFGGDTPYDCGLFGCSEREIMKPNKDEEIDEGYPVTNYGEYSLMFLYNLPMPAIVRAGLSLTVTDGMLFAHDTTRSFLTLSGVNRPFKEVSAVYLEQYHLSGSLGFNIPVYGVFLESEAATVASDYYLYVGATAGYAIVSKATQFSQIADVKDQLRYTNGMDTVQLLHKVTLDGLNRVRTSADVAIGWNFALEFATLGFEAFCSIPLSSVLEDADWKQYYGGLRFSVGYQWLPEEEEENKKWGSVF